MYWSRGRNVQTSIQCCHHSVPPNKSQKFLTTSIQSYCFLKSLTACCTGQMGSESSVLLVIRESSLLDTFQKRIRQCCEVVPCNLRHCFNIHFPLPHYIPGGLDCLLCSQHKQTCTFASTTSLLTAMDFHWCLERFKMYFPSLKLSFFSQLPQITHMWR